MTYLLTRALRHMLTMHLFASRYFQAKKNDWLYRMRCDTLIQRIMKFLAKNFLVYATLLSIFCLSNLSSSYSANICTLAPSCVAILAVSEIFCLVSALKSIGKTIFLYASGTILSCTTRKGIVELVITFIA